MAEPVTPPILRRSSTEGRAGVVWRKSHAGDELTSTSRYPHVMAEQVSSPASCTNFAACGCNVVSR